MRRFLALGLIAGAALPAAAQDVLQRPEGCVLVATAQSDNCTAENYFRCPGRSAFRLEVSDRKGGLQVQTYDADHGTLEIAYSDGGFRLKAKPKVQHPRVALKTGSIHERTTGTVYFKGSSQPSIYEGDYTYKGETRKLGGETFHRLSYSGLLSYPAVPETLTASGSVLFNERLDLRVAEVDVSDGRGGPARVTKLKSLALEGQKGFGSTKPKFGCRS